MPLSLPPPPNYLPRNLKPSSLCLFPIRSACLHNLTKNRTSLRASPPQNVRLSWTLKRRHPAFLKEVCQSRRHLLILNPLSKFSHAILSNHSHHRLRRRLHHRLHRRRLEGVTRHYLTTLLHSQTTYFQPLTLSMPP